MLEGPLMAWVTVGQLIIKIVFLLWVWAVRVETGLKPNGSARNGLILPAAIFFTIGAAVQFNYDFAHQIPHYSRMSLVIVGICISALGALLALLGKGKGRVVTAIASLELVLSWFIFP